MADVKAQCMSAFKHFAEVSTVGQSLSEDEKNYIKDKGMHKMLKECCGEDVAKAAEAQVFPKYCDKKTKKMAFDVFFADFMSELAATVIQNKKKLPKRPDLTNDEVKHLADELRAKVAAKHGLQSTAMKVDATTARLTDTSKYTGTHKERFDESGKGKGIAGRENVDSGSGYVKGYKNEDTYDKTH